MPGLIGIQANCATFGYTSRETATLLQVKLAGLQGSAESNWKNGRGYWEL